MTKKQRWIEQPNNFLKIGSFLLTETMARTGSSSTEAAVSSSSSASPSSASNNNHNASSNPSRPPSGVAMASTAAAAAAASAAAAAASSSSSSMSISDLVPLSMSVLRDKMMADMNTEHEALKIKMQQQEEDRLRLALTGPNNGRPVYCQASMKYGVTRDVEGTPYWEVSFDDNDDGTNITIPNFVATVAGLEIRLGDIVVFPFNTAKNFNAPAEHAGFDRTRDDTRQMANVSFTNDNRIGVLGRVGPILYEDYINLCHSLPPQGMKVPDFVRFMNDHQTNNNNDTVLLPILQIMAVTFPKSQIPGILPLLEDTTTENLNATPDNQPTTVSPGVSQEQDPVETQASSADASDAQDNQDDQDDQEQEPPAIGRRSKRDRQPPTRGTIDVGIESGIRE